ncbi:isoamyl alcohol oxidase [Aspergillus terreus]|uniref:Isoamyl alcohol oxidase n=1 Tax=Aspergillus terreus TaxID=33178 RepID=A0A5M3YRG7_ASPTE|nr:hypothetical protein ATETN484_0001087200 [Aspergillus terreus]GFF12727.1 isoamyl alcohol oxidase [Aspergillus terreus]
MPPAVSCYPGPYYNEEECAYVYTQWSNSSFQSLSPVGYVFPTDDPCPPVDVSSGQKAKECDLGPAPIYTVNATEPEELATGIAFAKKHNIRLVVRNTGHDILGKSEGYGALQIWIKYIRKGTEFHKSYAPSDGCKSTTWNGSALTIGGGYVWEDAYQEVFRRNMTIVGGGDTNVGCIGGYTQGGGHSPACHDYGLAADQVLEAQVVLSNGSIVMANPCQNPDLYFALRGGGGGTYGVVTSMTVKVYPSKPVIAQSLVIRPIGNNTEALLAAITEIYAHSPSISDAGFSGYGIWSINSPVPIYKNLTRGYYHTFAAMGQSQHEAEKAFRTLFHQLKRYNGTKLSISLEWVQFPTYGAYYRTMWNLHSPVSPAAHSTASRMLDKRALTSNRAMLRDTIKVVAGTPEQQTVNTLDLVGGGKIFEDAEDKLSGVNPAWRSTYVVHLLTRGWPADADPATAQAVKDDITYTKIGAMRALSSGMGSYMNEVGDDRYNPFWISDFFGSNYDRLASIKRKYDPDDVFYCPKCVGSLRWGERYLPGMDYGALCLVQP